LLREQYGTFDQLAGQSLKKRILTKKKIQFGAHRYISPLPTPVSPLFRHCLECPRLKLLHALIAVKATLMAAYLNTDLSPA